MEELSKMNQINNLAFDMMHKEMNPTEQFVYADKIYQLSLRPELNENQQVVLEWLKRNSNALKVPMLAIYELAELADENVRVAYRQIDRKGEFQVLAAFAEWGMKNDQ